MNNDHDAMDDAKKAAKKIAKPLTSIVKYLITSAVITILIIGIMAGAIIEIFQIDGKENSSDRTNSSTEIRNYGNSTLVNSNGEIKLPRTIEQEYDKIKKEGNRTGDYIDSPEELGKVMHATTASLYPDTSEDPSKGMEKYEKDLEAFDESSGSQTSTSNVETTSGNSNNSGNSNSSGTSNSSNHAGNLNNANTNIPMVQSHVQGISTNTTDETQEEDDDDKFDITSDTLQGSVKFRRKTIDGDKFYLTYVSPSKMDELIANYTKSKSEEDKKEALKHYTIERRLASSGGSGSLGDGNDYNVKTDESNASRVVTKEEMEQCINNHKWNSDNEKQHALDILDIVMECQETYKVSAVFVYSFLHWESNIGTANSAAVRANNWTSWAWYETNSRKSCSYCVFIS